MNTSINNSFIPIPPFLMTGFAAVPQTLLHVWTQEEEVKLTALVKKGKLTWDHIAAQIPGKSWYDCERQWTRIEKRSEVNKLQLKIFDKKELAKLEPLDDLPVLSEFEMSCLLGELPASEDEIFFEAAEKQIVITPVGQQRKWTLEANRKLIGLLYQKRLTWKQIAEQFPGRTGEQCSEHWREVILPKINMLKAKGLLEEGAFVKQYKVGREEPSISLQRKRKSANEDSERVSKVARTTLSTSPHKASSLTILDPLDDLPVLSEFGMSCLLGDLPALEDELSFETAEKTQVTKQPEEPSVPSSKSADFPLRQYDRWASEEDKKLIELVYQKNVTWKQIVEQFPGKTSEQCNDHWRQVILPKINKLKVAGFIKEPALVKQKYKRWTPEEDKRFFELAEEYKLAEKKEIGQKGWNAIAQHFPGRTGEKCRSHWSVVIKPQLNKQKQMENAQNQLIDSFFT